MRYFLGVSLALAFGCSTFIVADTPEQKAYALAAHYEAVLSVAATYVEREDADQDVKAAIKKADAEAYPVVRAVVVLANGKTLTICGPMPTTLDPEFVEAACAGDLPKAVGVATSIVAVMSQIIGDLQ